MNTISSKCQNCGSELWYNPKENCLTCKYCETNYFLPKKSDDAVPYVQDFFRRLRYFTIRDQHFYKILDVVFTVYELHAIGRCHLP